MIEKNEIKLLRSTWNFLLAQKELFIEKAKMATLTIEQKAEVELSLASMTGQLKRIDLHIHFLKFGSIEYSLESESLSIYGIVRRETSNEKYLEFIALNRDLKELAAINQTLKIKCYHLQSQLNSKSKDANATTEV
jgi:hypothetical protein